MGATFTCVVADIRSCVNEFREAMVMFPYEVRVKPLLKNRGLSYADHLEFNATIPVYAYPAYVWNSPVVIKILYSQNEEYELFKSYEYDILQNRDCELKDNINRDRLIAFAEGRRLIRRCNDTKHIFNNLMEDFKFLVDRIEAVEANTADDADYAEFKEFNKEMLSRWEEVQGRITNAIRKHDGRGLLPGGKK